MMSVPFLRSQPGSAEPDPSRNSEKTAPAWLKPYVSVQRAHLGLGFCQLAIPLFSSASQEVPSVLPFPSTGAAAEAPWSC